jgi:hypothetical protein
MPFGMEIVDYKQRVRKKLGLPGHAIRAQGTSKVVYYPFGSLRPMCDNGRENIIPSFSSRDAMKSVANTVGTPSAHDSPGQTLFSILGIILGAFSPSFSRRL